MYETFFYKHLCWFMMYGAIEFKGECCYVYK